MIEKLHLVLNWVFDVPNYKLTCKIGSNLTYEVIEGGCKGFTKTYNGEESHVSIHEWENTEKFWISEHYGQLVGYFQPDQTRVKRHPIHGWSQTCVNGLGPDGEYLDHMQRMQILLEGNDMAFVFGGGQKDLFLTPDQGKTIYKRIPTRDVNYPEELMKDKNAYWSEWPQACLMQPRTKGPRLSNYDELSAAGAALHVIEKCQNGEWDKAPHPELQQWYIYPTK